MYDAATYGTVAEWVSGTGTLIAVSVALYLGLRAPAEHLVWDVTTETFPGAQSVHLTIRNAGMMDMLVTEAWLEQRGVVRGPSGMMPRRIEPGHAPVFQFEIGGVTPRENDRVRLWFRTGRGKRYNVKLSPAIVGYIVGDTAHASDPAPRPSGPAVTS